MSNILKISIDIGVYSTKVSFLDNDKSSDNEVYVDFSGGYGEKSFLSWVFFSNDTKEFIFGEYAKNEMQYSKGVLFDNLPKLIEENQKVTLHNGSYTGIEIVSKYIENLLKYIKGLNPTIDFFEVVFINKYGNENFKENILKLSSNIKSIKKTILLDNILSYFYGKNIKDSKYVIIDLAHKDTTFYQVEKVKDEVLLNNIKSYDSFNFNDIDIAFSDMLTQVFKESAEDVEFSDFEAEKILQLARENKKKFITSFKKKKDVKVYYDFVTPPFAATIKKEYIAGLISEEIEKAKAVIEKFFKGDYNQKVLCVGYGTAFSYVQDTFSSYLKDITFHKDDFFVLSSLSYYSKEEKLSILKDYEDKVTLDTIKDDLVIGFMGKEFIPLYSSSLSEYEVTLLINEYIEDTLTIPLYKSQKGDISAFSQINIDYFKKRAKGSLKLKFRGELEKDTFSLNVSDYGFGEIYVKTAYNEKFQIKI